MFQFVFDLPYCFFVVMGGVRVSVDEIISLEDLNRRWVAVFENARKPLTVRLGPPGLLRLARSGHWFYFSHETINDKSKADVFQKVLVLVQVSWMVVQCIARHSYGLPLTLLEVHTMVHVICAIAFYAFWIQVS